LPTSVASRLAKASAVDAFVPDYRCGAVPDFAPGSLLRRLEHRRTDAVMSTLLACEAGCQVGGYAINTVMMIAAGKVVGVERRKVLRELLHLAWTQGTRDAFVIEVFAAAQEITRRLLALVGRSRQQEVQPVPRLLDIDASIGIGRPILIPGFGIHFGNRDRCQPQQPAEEAFRSYLPNSWPGPIVEEAGQCRWIGEQPRDVRLGRAVQCARHPHIKIVSV
jgi:hypothetical protein